MRKLKKFNLQASQILSKEEMLTVSGMDFYSTTCSYEDQKCAVSATGGFNTGTCKWIYESSTHKYLKCVVD